MLYAQVTSGPCFNMAENKHDCEGTGRKSHQDYVDYLQNVILKFIEGKNLKEEKTQMAVKVDPFVTLPPEILFHILTYLCLDEICISRRVSKTWKKIIGNYFRHIRTLNCVPFESTLTENGLKCVLNSVQNLQELYADTCWASVTEDNLCILANNCPRLRTLSISKCKGVTDAILRRLARCCKELEELDLSSCFQISDKGLVPISKNCLKLREVYVSSCYGVTDVSVESLASNCTLLKDLDVSWCYKITDQSLQFFLQPEKHLQSLRIKSCSRVSEEIITSLVNKGISVNYFF